MDEQSRFAELLQAAREFLPPSVFATCESLNGHGEWELAFGHCKRHLQDVQVPDVLSTLLAACEESFGVRGSKRTPNYSRHRTAVGRR